MTGRTCLTAALALCVLNLVPTQEARAGDSWACEVLLCISNPGGMTQFKECVPPIRRLITHLALGKSFPTCTGGGTRSVKYQKPRNGQNGILFILYEDGRRETYIVPRARELAPLDPQADDRPEDFR